MIANGDSSRRTIREPLIRELRLKTHLLKEMRSFYKDKIGFPISADTVTSVTFQAGKSLLTFEQVTDASKPWYHFAFNIPQNLLLEARKWQLERTLLMPIPERLRDPRFPDDVVNYSHWNAHALFFFDPAGNVVEYIARHDLRNDASGPFSVRQILYASEIGLIVDDVPAAASKVKEVAGVEIYKGGSDVFTAMGDEHGLLLVMKRDRHLNFQDNEEKAAKIFPTIAHVTGEKRIEHKLDGFPYELTVG